MQNYLQKIHNYFFSPKKKVRNPKLMVPSYLNRHEGRDFLVLASGKYLKKQEESVREFIRRYQPIVMAAHDLAWFAAPHYHTFINRGRFCSYIDTVHKESAVILSPYFRRSLIKTHYKGDYEIAMFRNEDNRTFDIDRGIISSNCRSSALLNIGISIAMGAQNIFVAGLDGFIDVYNSYEGYVVDKPQSCSYDELREIQREYLSLIQRYLNKNGKKPFCILTKTSFSEWFRDIHEFLK